MKYVDIESLKNVPPFRKIAVGTWRSPGDPQIYATMEIDLTNAYKWKEENKTNNPNDPKITVTHMVARAMGLVMRKYPDLNGFIRFGKIYLRKSVDGFFQVAVKHESGREDLSGIKIEELDQKKVSEIAISAREKIKELREDQNTELQKTVKMLNLFPTFIIKFLLFLASFIGYGLNKKLFALPKDSFGGFMISNVGSLGLDKVYAPLVPYSRVPMVIAVGMAKKRPVVVEDELKIREILTLNFSIDHRFCDGSLGAKIAKELEIIFNDPWKYF